MTEPARPFVIDSDGHVIEPPRMWAQYLDPRFHDRLPQPSTDEDGTSCYEAGDVRFMRLVGSLASRPKTTDGRMPIGGWDPAARLRDMDIEGIDVAVLYPTVSFYFPELNDPVFHAALCRAYNDWLAEYCRTNPQRLVGVALLPHDDPEIAIAELERATNELGLRGAFFRPNPYRGRPIQHPCYEPFWDCASSLGVPITVHEGISDSLPTLGRDRSIHPVLLDLMSHPFEQMAACSGLILGGVLERHPELRFAFLQSGCGWLPYWIARMDGHWDTWGAQLPKLSHKPSEIFARQCFVSMGSSEMAARNVLDAVGDDCLLWASDYPHTDATFPGAVRESLDLLADTPEASVRKVMGANAARLYGLAV